MAAAGYLLVALAMLVILPWDPAIIPGPMLRNEARTPADAPQDTQDYSRKVLMFPCSGVNCQAWLYLPKAPAEAGGKPPVVVAAHGLGCQKDFNLHLYGERFARAGLAAFIFDYRTFGGSEGEPRHWASPKRHLQDYESAVEYIKSDLRDVVDVNRINLWGLSFSGGHVLTLAGSTLRDNVTSVVAQVPLIDGMDWLVRSLKRRPATVVRAVVAAVHDSIRGLIGYPPAYFYLTGEPGSTSVMDIGPDDTRQFYSVHPKQRQGGWRNMVRAMLALEGATYRPIKHVPNIRAPVLYLAATQDNIIPMDSIETALHQTPDGQLFKYKTGHFGVLSGAPFTFYIQHMIKFLRDKNGMKHIIISSAEAQGLGPPQPHAAHKSAGPAVTDEIQEQRSAVKETASEL